MFYDYHCQDHGRFTVRQAMFDKHEANCPICGESGERRYSAPSIRFAEPLTTLQDLGKRHGHHLGYEKVGWIPDSGILPKPGQPYKTAKEVAREEYGGLNEI